MQSDKGRSRLRMVVCLVMVVSAGAFAGNYGIGAAAASYSGGISANPNPVSTWSSTTVTCSWNAFTGGTGAYTANCMVDGASFFTTQSASGTYSKTFPAYYFSNGAHTMAIYYSTGADIHFHRLYSYYSATLTVNEPNYFQFKVIDQNGYGLSGVTITLDYSSSSCGGGLQCMNAGTTDSTGSSTIYITYFTPGNTYTMNMQKSGWWTDAQSFKGTHYFYVGLPPNQLVYVYSIVGFSDSPYSQVSWTTGVSYGVDVGAYIAGSGFDFKYTVSQSTTFTSTPPPNGKPLEERDGYYSTGVFHYDMASKTYTIDNAWVYGPRATLDFGYFIPDYMTPATATGGTCFFSPCQFSVQPGPAISRDVTVSGTFTVQLGLDVSVGLSVDAIVVGASVSVELKVYFAVSVGVSYDLKWTINNTDTVTHTFEVYDESTSATTFVPHIWQIS